MKKILVILLLILPALTILGQNTNKASRNLSTQQMQYNIYDSVNESFRVMIISDNSGLNEATNLTTDGSSISGISALSTAENIESISMLIYPQSAGTVVSFGYEQDIYIGVNGSIRLGSLLSDSSIYVNGASSNSVTMNAWNYIVVNFNRNIVDTIQIAPDNVFGGKYQQLLLWNRQLSSSEVNSLYNSGNPKSYRIDEENYWGTDTTRFYLFTELVEPISSTGLYAMCTCGDTIVAIARLGGVQQVVMHSYDYGRNWSIVDSFNINGTINELYYNNINLLGVVNGIGIIKSTDYGASWDTVYTNTSNDIFNSIVGNDTLVLATSGRDTSLIIRSVDYGNTFDSLSVLPTGDRARKILRVKDSVYIAGTYVDGHLCRSSDYGATWSDLGRQSTSQDIRGGSVWNDSIVVFGSVRGVLNEAIVHRSTDAGLSFTEVDTLTGSGGTSVQAIILGETSWALNNVGDIFKSSDYGITWDLFQTITSEISGQTIATINDSIYFCGFRPYSTIARYPPEGIWAEYLFEDPGYSVIDESPNSYNIALSGDLYSDRSTSWDNAPLYYSKEIKLADEDVSSTAATTTLFKLPPNVVIERMIVKVDAAFAATDTLYIGDSSDSSAVTSMTGLDEVGSTTYTFTDPIYTGSGSESTQLYIQKNQATSSGYIKYWFYLKNYLGE